MIIGTVPGKLGYLKWNFPIFAVAVQKMTAGTHYHRFKWEVKMDFHFFNWHNLQKILPSVSDMEKVIKTIVSGEITHCYKYKRISKTFIIV